MKKILFIILMSPFVVYGQHAIPKDILTSSAVLTITSTEENYQNIADFSSQKFEELGIEIPAIIFFDENPTLRRKSAKAKKAEISKHNPKYIYNVQINVLNGSQYFLTIVDAEGFDTPQTKIHYLNTNKNLEKLFDKFAKDLKKLN